MGLAPMTVRPENQKQAIGSALIEAGLKQCERAGIGAVVVLGHPEYYPRFGFIPASQYEISCEYDVPDEVFMAMEIRSSYLENPRGTISYHPAFAEL
jgi:putative acetyltransferase